MDRQDDRMDRQDARTNINTLDKNMAVLTQRFDTLEDKLDEIIKTLDALPTVYATIERIKPLETFFKGMQGAGVVILMAILGLLLSHVIPGFNL